MKKRARDERSRTMERKAACWGQIKEELAKKRAEWREKGWWKRSRSRPRVIKNAVVVLAIRMTNDVVDGAKLVRWKDDRHRESPIWRDDLQAHTHVRTWNCVRMSARQAVCKISKRKIYRVPACALLKQRQLRRLCRPCNSICNAIDSLLSLSLTSK